METIIKINTNVTTKENFDGLGNGFRSGEPSVSYKSNFKLIWRLFTDTPDADMSGADIESWKPLNLAGCGAVVTCDNDFKHRVTGTLASEIPADTPTSSVEIKTSASSAEIPASGIIAFFDAGGNVREVEYSSITSVSGGFILELSSPLTVENGISAGASINISQEPLFQAMFLPEESSPGDGLFVFDCYAYSKRLAVLADTSSTKTISVQGLEILPFSTADGVVREMPSYLVDTFSLTINLAEVGSAIPEYTGDQSELLAALASLVVHGLDIQVHNAEKGWHDYPAEDLENAEYARSLTAYRIRLSGSTGEWSLPVPLIHGADGEDAPYVMIQYSPDGNTWGNSSTGSKFIRFSSDGGESWSAGSQYVGSDGVSAGFGIPTINVSTGEPGTSASATVTASGEDTAKVFSFGLTVPRGATGNAAGFGNITASAQSVPPEYSAIATVTSSGTNESKNLAFSFQIPQGKKGDPMKVDATGLTTDLDNYAAEAKGFVFLATNTGNIYIKASDSVGDWSDPVGFQGPQGTAAGFGIPTAQITTIAEDASPSVSVTASGDNTKKVFAFDFQLPKAPKGDKGDSGIIENFEIPVTSLSDGKIKLKINALPVMLKSPSGQFYPVEKTRMLGSVSDGWTIDPTPYLGYENTASFSGTWFVYCAGAVKGERGEDGANFDPDATGVFAERSQYDSQPKGFSFLATDQEGAVYIKNSNGNGDWSDAIPFRGPKGDSPEINIVDDKWVVNGVDTGKPSRGEPGQMASVSIADNGNWVVNGVDTGKPSRGKGANVIMSPTPPTEPFNGMILISTSGTDAKYFDLESLKVVKGAIPPADAVEGTIFIKED